MPEAKRGTEGSQTLERGLAVLSALGSDPRGLTVKEVVEAVGLHQSVTYRLLISLQRTGFATRGDDGRYCVGSAVVSLADRVRPRIRDVAGPPLRQLAVALDATASLVEIIGEHAVATVVAEPPTDGPRFSYRLGNRDPLDRGAGGIAALASLPFVEGESERVTRTREAGFVITHSEINPGAHGVAAPIPDVVGTAASVNVITNRQDLAATAGPRVRDTALAIAAALVQP